MRTVPEFSVVAEPAADVFYSHVPVVSYFWLAGWP